MVQRVLGSALGPCWLVACPFGVEEFDDLDSLTEEKIEIDSGSDGEVSPKFEERFEAEKKELQEEEKYCARTESLYNDEVKHKLPKQLVQPPPGTGIPVILNYTADLDFEGLEPGNSGVQIVIRKHEAEIGHPLRYYYISRTGDEDESKDRFHVQVGIRAAPPSGNPAMWRLRWFKENVADKRGLESDLFLVSYRFVLARFKKEQSNPAQMARRERKERSHLKDCGIKG
ncbi:hypothetical protein BDV06DRAFT_225668 [Aspergillus oleicola]